MKKSQFKEYLKTEVLKMTEATKEDIEAQKELNNVAGVTLKFNEANAKSFQDLTL